ncbi:MAG TPA: sugar ABC transporter permease [Spirochaetia bacterium]|nr:sugar ABC transporter permease [Spirochaetia bacterium]
MSSHAAPSGSIPAGAAPKLSGAPRRRAVSPLPYLLVLPTLVFVGLFTIWPTLSSVIHSLYTQRLNIAKYRNPIFAGLSNYESLFRDSTFYLVLGNTALYLVGTVLPAVALGFLFALLINRKLPAIGVARLLLFQPTVLPMVSVATIWLFLFTPDYGLLNSMLQLFGYHGPQNWTGNPNMALLAIVIVSVWKNAGFYMVFYLAGMQSLPLSVYEAARLDGAGPVATTLRITLPLLRRTTLFVTTIAFIGAFQTVDHVFVLTQGGPSDASNILLYYLWQVRFSYLDVGRASAVTVVLVFLMLIFTVTNFVMTERGGRTDVDV